MTPLNESTCFEEDVIGRDEDILPPSELDPSTLRPVVIRVCCFDEWKECGRVNEHVHQRFPSFKYLS